MDDASPHRSRETSSYVKEVDFQQMPHPPFSSDFTPSHFYRLVLVRGSPRGQSFENADEPIETIRDETRFIQSSELDAVFRN
jgi:hypothetical protein